MDIDGIQVVDAKGDACAASELIAPNGRARMLKDVRVTKDETPVPAVVCTRAKNMKEPWCLATSRADLDAARIVALYGRKMYSSPSRRSTLRIASRSTVGFVSFLVTSFTLFRASTCDPFRAAQTPKPRNTVRLGFACSPFST